MGKKHVWEQKWSTRSGAEYGCLLGFIAIPLRHIHQAVSNQIPEDVYTHVFGELIVGGVTGATLFAVAAALLNRLAEWSWKGEDNT
jgi:hypothetical protein